MGWTTAWPADTMDCAAAAACARRASAPPPDAVDALIAAMERRGLKLTPRYARTVTSPLVAALRARLVNSTGLSVFLAHDTALMPLLVALTTDYDGAWAPYAAAVVVETWTLPGGSDAVRVAYDGAYRTLAGCPEPNAPRGPFLAATAWVRDRDCSAAPRVGSLRVDAGDAPAHGSSVVRRRGRAARSLANAVSGSAWQPRRIDVRCCWFIFTITSTPNRRARRGGAEWREHRGDLGLGDSGSSRTPGVSTSMLRKSTVCG